MADTLITEIVGAEAYGQLDRLNKLLERTEQEAIETVKALAGIGKEVESSKMIRDLAKAHTELTKAQARAEQAEAKLQQVRERQKKAAETAEQQEQRLAEALDKTAVSIAEAREQNKLLTKARNETNVTTEEGAKQLNEYNAKIDANTEFIKQNGDAALKQKMNIGNYASAWRDTSQAFAALPGPLGAAGRGLQAVQGGIQAVTKAGKAFLATPIGAAIGAISAAVGVAVGAFKLMGSWFTRTAEGQAEFRRATAGLKFDWEELKDRASDVGRALYKAFTDPRGAIDGMRDRIRTLWDDARDTMEKTREAMAEQESFGGKLKAAFSGVATAFATLTGNMTKDEAKELAERRKRSEELAVFETGYIKRKREATVEVAELEQEIADLRAKSKDYDLGADERYAASLKVFEKNNELAAIRTDLAERELHIVKESNALHDSGEQDLQAEAEAEAKVLQITTQKRQAERELMEARRTGLRELEAEREKDVKDYIDALDKEDAAALESYGKRAEAARAAYEGGDARNAVADYAAYVEARDALLRESETAELARINAEASERIRVFKLTGKELQKLNGETEKRLTEVSAKYRRQRNENAAKDAEEAQRAIVSQITAQNEEIEAASQEALDRQLIELGDMLDRGALGYGEYQKRVEAAEQAALRQRLEDTKKYLNEMLAAEGVTDEERRRILTKYAELHKQLAQQMEAVTEETTGSALMSGQEQWEAFGGFMKEKASEIWGTVADAIGNAIGNQLQAVEEQIDAVNRRYDGQMERIKASGLTRRQEAAETARAEREKEREMEALQERQAELKRKQAIWDKANAAAQIGIQTALAIMAVWSQPGLGVIVKGVMSGVVGALGAAQLATVLATKIPEYKSGREGGPAELAVVGDGGVPEVIQTKRGAYLTPPTPTLAFLEAGDKVFRSEREYARRKPSATGRTALDLTPLVKEQRLTTEAVKDTKSNLFITSAGLSWIRSGGKFWGNGRV